MAKIILFLAANPIDTSRIRLDEEVREIYKELYHRVHRPQFELQQRWAVRPADLQSALLDTKPQFVHFSGHGAGDEGLILEDNNGKSCKVSPQALADLFSLFPTIQCVVLNACYSESQAEAIARQVPYVIGIRQDLSDLAAITFASGFYRALGTEGSVEVAYRLGCNAMRLEGFHNDCLPVLKTIFQWNLVVKADISGISNERISAIINHLQQLTKDKSLRLMRMEGKIFSFEGSREGYTIIKGLYEKGEIKGILGLSVKQILSTTALTSKYRTANVFFSYSHKDEELRCELANHLSILERNGIISSWCDRQIDPGVESEKQVDERINSANIILLLVSADFIASNYCWNTEVKQAMERYENSDAYVVPIILRPVNWQNTPFGDLQALPRDAKPVTTWNNRDEAFLNISCAIEKLAHKLIFNHT